MSLLTVTDLSAAVAGKPILNGLSLTLNGGEVHAIMGPNGAGKSTLAHVLAGREGYDVTGGTVDFGGQDLLAMPPEARAREGLFLAFQYPVEIPGVTVSTFLRHAVNAHRRHRGEAPLDALEFVRVARAAADALGVPRDMLKRAVNAGFSGGEKKRFETLQMALLKPRLAVLDETDSGLDIDALRAVADGINRLRAPNRAVLAITHYQRLLDYLKPDHVHVLAGGRIAKSGGPELALELEESGYAAFGG